MQRVIKKLNTLSITKYIVVYSIPLVCCIALLALFSITISMPSNNTASALNEIGDSTGQPTTSASTTASLTLDTRDIQVRLDAGSIGYASKDITIKATNISSYALTITAPEGLTGPTEFTGADGKTPTDMANNTWGYNYTDGIVDEETLPTIIYNSFTGTAQTLESGTTNPTSNTKTLSFAAKFGNAISGSYKANVVLSLVTTPKAITFDGITTMQEMTPDICNKADTYASSILRDVRDNNYYTVTKLEDGRCWMTENLRISGTIRAEESDFDSPSSITIPNEKSGFTSDNQYTLRGYVEGDTGYYNWYTATAQGGDSSVTTDGQNVSTSICPSGWKLPTGGRNYTEGETSEWYNLVIGGIFNNNPDYIKEVLSYNVFTNPEAIAVLTGPIYDFSLTGAVSNHSLNGYGTSGGWWSRTAESNTNAYRMNIATNSNTVSPSTGSSARSAGYAIRCIAADPDLTEISTMQEMTPRVCEKSATGATNTLTDTRDDSKYSIRKMEDGKCWMTSNLKLKGNTNLANPNPNNELTPSDTNITSNWKLPSTLTSLSSSNFSSPNYYAVESYISNKANAGETGYYSWAAATAGAGADSNLKSGSVSTSICPKGWRLPGGNGDTVYGNEFYDLFNSMGLGITLSATGRTNWTSTQLSIVQNSDYNFKFTGNVSGSALGSTSVGYWWSNTVSSETDARSTDMYSTYAYLGAGSNTRCYGIPVRCIAQ